MVAAMTDPLISTADLAARLGDPNLRVLDASWHLDGRDGHGPWRAAHIPGARFFDIDAISDPHTALPHMQPTPEDFAKAMGALGVAADNVIVVYDQYGLFSAARAWWSLRAMGADEVRVLDGGLPKWRAEGRPLESGGQSIAPAVFHARARPELVRDLAQMRTLVERGSEQIADVRPAPRFRGEAPEPRHGLRGGHMPGAVNLPYATLLTEAGVMKPAEDLRALFAEAGLDLERPTVTTCGSGVSAPILALALARLGHDTVAVYDGSWTEWGGQADTPVAVGA
jgi:thiosulfate/3-mercaptopyruvate sulfurtransferase